MLRSDFRPRAPVSKACDSSGEDRLDPYELLHHAIGMVLVQIENGRTPIAVSDAMAKLLSAALRRQNPTSFEEPMAIYTALFMGAPPSVLRDIYNIILADHKIPIRSDNLDLTKELGD
jgi:hypothetical protein